MLSTLYFIRHTNSDKKECLQKDSSAGTRIVYRFMYLSQSNVDREMLIAL